MVPSKRPDIADFFRPYGKTIPRKRSTPDLNDADPIVRTGQNAPTTPKLDRTADASLQDPAARTPSCSRIRPLATPRTGRSIDIPIRSPVSETSTSLKRSSLLEKPKRSSHPREKSSSLLSFADVPIPNRGVVEDGKLVAVRDSDDSDDSLESLSEIVSRKNKNNVTSSASQSDRAAHQEDERKRILSIFTGGRSEPILQKDKVRELQKLEQANKFDLNFIFEEEMKEKQLQERLAKANADLEISTREMEEQKQEDIDKNMLAAILQSNDDDLDPEELARLVGAVERTEALTGEKHFSFFVKRGPNDLFQQNRSNTTFPASAIPLSLWASKDIAARNRAYLSGFITELCRKGEMADNAVRWTFNAVLTEQRDDLRAAYIKCVRAASSKWTRANVNPTDIQRIFELLGTDPAVLRDGTEVLSKPWPRHQVSGNDFSCLLTGLQLLSSICQDLDFPTLSKLTSTIFRLPLDQRVMADNQICLIVQDFLTQLITLPDLNSRHHVHERLFSDLGANLRDSTLQARLLTHLVPTSKIVASVRIRLASNFLLGTELTEQFLNPPQISTSLCILTRHLSISPIFTTTKSISSLSSSTDYMKLTALTAVLDAAIANGHPPMTFADRNEEDLFNADVDNLAGHIHKLFVSITDSGASHLRRTEAKDALQELYVKLLHRVRTRPRKKRHVFDIHGNFIGGRKEQGRIRDVLDVEQEMRGRDFMARFLKSEEMRNSPIDRESTVNGSGAWKV